MSYTGEPDFILRCGKCIRKVYLEQMGEDSNFDIEPPLCRKRCTELFIKLLTPAHSQVDQ